MNLSEEKIIAGRHLLEQLDLAKVDVAAALWVFEPHIQLWKLGFYIPKIESPRDTYKILQKALGSQPVPPPKVGFDEIIIFKHEAPLIVLLSYSIKTPKEGVVGIVFSGNVVNGQLLPDCYIYRLHV